MAIGDVVCTDRGLITLSGALLKAAIDAVNLGSAAASGAEIFLIPTANGRQVQVLSTTVTDW